MTVPAPAQHRSEEELVLDARIDSPGREGLTGTAPTSVYGPLEDPEDVSTGPDHRPLSQQPSWRQDFPVDWPADQFVARRDFAKFLVLTSGAFVVGQGWIAAQSLIRSRRPALPRIEIARLSALPVGAALVFSYPSDHERCLLMRPEEQVLVAFSQACTHLSCAVVPDMARGVLHCPCHEGYFDLRTGRNIAGPPPRPLPRITLAIEGDRVYAVGVERVTV
jgi:nitrite reductase/ring-hydroxylating ferredoxin subunit